jgi:hypothetical protein
MYAIQKRISFGDSLLFLLSNEIGEIISVVQIDPIVCLEAENK